MEESEESEEMALEVPLRRLGGDMAIAASERSITVWEGIMAVGMLLVLLC